MTARAHVRHSHRRTGSTVLLVAALLMLIAAPLPARAAPLLFTVTTVGDSGDSAVGDGQCTTAAEGCTLRAAIEEANATPDVDTIDFDIAGGCATACTISPSSALPDIVFGVVIDGYAQPGASSSGTEVGSDAVIKIELSGLAAGPANGLTLSSGVSLIRGLAIGGFSGNAPLGNGIVVAASGSRIYGNYIGTDVTGTIDHGNAQSGVVISGAGDVRVGGVEPADANVISGNRTGILVQGVTGTGDRIQGNYIGTDATGTVRLANDFNGIRVQGGANSLIGGTRPGDRNIISGNGNYGIQIDGSAATGNTVLGNYIGTDVTGTVDLGNTYGVGILGAPGNVIGLAESGAGNVISGNDNGFGSGIAGVFITGATASGNTVQGNRIGTDAAGTAPLGNKPFGVYISGAPNNVVGGTFPGEGNTIAYNSLDGVRVDGAASTGDAIRGNSIHSNGGKGIETATGGNLELAPPTIASTAPLAGTACAGCHVDVFSDDADEGRIYHGSVDADGSGTWSFPGALSGPNLTATATDVAGDTSEFSSPFAPVATPCPAGSFSATGETPCTPAPAGAYVPGSGATSATPCAAGTFSPSAGAIACTPAPVDTYVPTAGASSPTPCPAGTTTNGQVGQTACTPIPVAHDLTVNLAGSASASGTVTSAPAGISCGSDCTESFPDGTVVTLSASLSGPGAASATFAGFGGDADCTDGAVTMTASLTCIATFNVTAQTVNAATGAGPVTFTTSAGSLASLAAVAESSLPATGKPAGVTFPFGLFSWTVDGLASGQTVTMTVSYPTPVTAGSPFWKVIGSTWTDASALIGSNDGDAVLTLTITDGGFGDADGVANGAISDPGGVGVTAPPTTGSQLTIKKAGNGQGTVTSTPAGIDCGTDCTESYAPGTVVVLKAIAAPGSTFLAFTGSWDCLDGRVTMSVDRTCTAVFVQVKLTIKKAGNGQGAVTSTPAGIDCGTDCTESYALGTVVSLRPVAAPGSVFAGWSGSPGCSNGRVTLVWDTTCTATFRLTSR